MFLLRTTLWAAAIMSISSSLSMADGPSSPAGSAAEREFRSLHDAYLEKFKPLFVRSAKAWWVANTTGSDEAYAEKKKAEAALVDLHSDKATFAKLKSLRDGGQVTDPVQKRLLEVMYLTFLPGQADPALQKKIVEIENDVEQIFNTHRSRVGGKELSENDVRQIVSDTKDSAQAREAWEGYMAVGQKIEGKLKEVVRLRNQLATSLGFKNFYVMKLELDEIGDDQLIRVFDELDSLTAGPFAQLKGEIDKVRAAKFGIDVKDLRPWHFGDLFFQEAPAMQALDLDEVFKDQDLLALTRDYYESMGLEVDDIIARSDLYEKPGKSPHAFSTDLDREGDVRTLCNLKKNAYWMDTLLHELGHAVYDKYIDKDVPFVLHEASHSITTEGFAMMIGAMCKNEDWLEKCRKLPPEKAVEVVAAARRELRAEKLIFSRWTQVMVRFERGMYDNPQQDLGKLWWDLKKKYQLLNPPETTSRPDYAAKIHIVTAPVYYHSYMMGDLFACQVHNEIAAEVLGVSDPTTTSFYGKKEAGDYLRKHIFGPGNLYSWNDLTKRATGEPLTAKFFAKQYVNR
ncbi:MAG TPA: M2 family metallopeptidase [Phycisphaerae bacterium]|nr:M2 family metallopeptidase [Phycisphaerae bacterium]